jgi:hypothetical protein
VTTGTRCDSDLSPSLFERVATPGLKSEDLVGEDILEYRGNDNLAKVSLDADNEECDSKALYFAGEERRFKDEMAGRDDIQLWSGEDLRVRLMCSAPCRGIHLKKSFGSDDFEERL